MNKVAIAGLATIAIGIAFMIYAGMVYSEINRALSETNRIISEQRSVGCNAPPGAPCPWPVDSLPKVPYPPPDDKLETGIVLVLAGIAAATAKYWFKKFVSFLRFLYIPRRLLIAGLLVVSVHVSLLVFGPYIRYCTTGFEFARFPCTPLDALVEDLYYLMGILWFNTVWIGPAMVAMAIMKGWRPAIHRKTQSR